MGDSAFYLRKEGLAIFKSKGLIVGIVIAFFAVMKATSNNALAGGKKIKKKCQGVPKTGQTTMYAEGDDGDLQMGMAWPDPRFTDNGDDTVTDNLTGLMWTKYVFGLMTWSDALDECDSCTVGNYNDWRLPNVKELQSLIHYGFRNPALPDTTGTGHGSECDPFCGVSNFTWFWSSTTVSSEITNNYAWMVAMHEGSLDIRNKDDPISVSVWPVRGGE